MSTESGCAAEQLPPAAELVLLQVVGGVNEENAGRELALGVSIAAEGAR